MAHTPTHATGADAGSGGVATLRAVTRDVGTFLYCQIAPVAVKFCVYPLERTRLLMQTRHTNPTFDGSALRSLQATTQHMRSEGRLFSAAWRGFTPTVVRWGPSQYTHLFLKDHIAARAPAYSKRDAYAKWFGSKVASGAATGVIVSLAWAYPLDILRQQLATKHSGTWRHAATDVYRKHGLGGFYRGFLMATPGLMLFRGVQLGGWDIVKDHYGPADWAAAGVAFKFAHAQIISLCGSLCAYPCDTIRRSLVACEAGESYREVLHRGVASAGGVRRFFYAGFAARIMTSVVNGALLQGYDQWKATR